MLTANEQLRGQNTRLMIQGAVANTSKDAKLSSALYDVTKGTSTALLPDLLVFKHTFYLIKQMYYIFILL